MRRCHMQTRFQTSGNLFKEHERRSCVPKPFPKRQILDSSKLEQFAVDNFNMMRMAECCPKGQKTLGEKEKLLVTSNFSFSRCVFKRLVLQTRKNQGLFGKGLRVQYTTRDSRGLRFDPALDQFGFL